MKILCRFLWTYKREDGMPKRIAAAKKAKILAFIEKFNSKNGRGGQGAAADKFGVSRQTIVNWLDQKDTAVVKRRGRPPKVASSTNTGNNDLRLIRSDLEALTVMVENLARTLRRITK
jgi:threonine synthase